MPSPSTGRWSSPWAAIASEYGIWLHGGSFAELADDGQHFNTAVLFAPDGRLVAAYRKVHLFGFDGGETVLMSGGDELIVAETPLGLTGLATCYDLRFPELFRALVDAGASTFLMASGWPTPRIEHWTSSPAPAPSRTRPGWWRAMRWARSRARSSSAGTPSSWTRPAPSWRRRDPARRSCGRISTPRPAPVARAVPRARRHPDRLSA